MLVYLITPARKHRSRVTAPALGFFNNNGWKPNTVNLGIPGNVSRPTAGNGQRREMTL